MVMWLLDIYKGYLPYRQLRKDVIGGGYRDFCYLPYRQLRKDRELAIEIGRSYLPYRQLRNAYQEKRHKDDRYLPYRQVIYFIVLFLWLTSDGGRLFVLRG